MTVAVHAKCRRPGCANNLPQGLTSERLCLDHFLDEAFLRTDETLERAHQGEELGPSDLEWLLSDALAVVKNLEEGAGDPNPEQRDRMLELLLILANLHEYVAHHSARLVRPA
jgi:hypothetical protein